MKEDNTLPQYEFQAFDRFWRPTRGKVYARTKREAKDLVKARGFRRPLVWLCDTKPWVALGKTKAGGEYHVPLLKLKDQDDNTIVYEKRNLLKMGFGLLFFLMGVGLIIFSCNSFFDNELLPDLVPILFVFLVGMLFLAVGAVILLHRFELQVKRNTHELIIRMRIIPFQWKYERIDATDAERVVLHKEIFYSRDGEICHVVSLFINGESIQVDASSSKKAELEIGQKIAEYLNIPLVCEEK